MRLAIISLCRNNTVLILLSNTERNFYMPPHSLFHSPVAADPIIVSLVRVSSTVVRVEWSQPSGGASVTGYVIHYSDGSTDRSMAASSTSADITGLVSDGRTYSISVEATSEQLSGESDAVDITEARELYPSEGAIYVTHNWNSSFIDLVILNTNVMYACISLVEPAPCPPI